jgi:hypothetical protein
MASYRTLARATALALTVVVLVASVAMAQTPPLPAENHYKAYLSSPITMVRPVRLADQFATVYDSLWVFDRFATPTDKIHDGVTYPILHPEVHMDWWRLVSPHPQPSRVLVATDQFGREAWVVGEARYLLTPSLKYPVAPFPPVPINNHYLCYDAISGPLLQKPVILIDQFGTADVVVLHPKLFCNPVEKRVWDAAGNEIVYPIVDPTAHLTCYLVQNPNVIPREVQTLDQFGYWQIQIYENDCLCVPALKDYPLKTEKTTWGKIKSLYRN